MTLGALSFCLAQGPGKSESGTAGPDLTLLYFHLFSHPGQSCEAGWEIKNRDYTDSAGFTMVATDKQFLCNGQVTAWRYQGKQSNAFRAIVWRPVTGSTTQFQIVGINDIPAGVINTPVTYTVPEDKRITVKAGDMIGWSFGDPLIANDRNIGTYRIFWLGGHLHDSLQVNGVHTFSLSTERVRDYSIAATVGW